jgi:hypothetical protein
MECRSIGGLRESTRVLNCHGPVLILFLVAAGSLSAQDLIDKSAPNDRNTDLQFDFSISNTGKRGTYRVIRLDTGETLALGHVGREVSSRTTLLSEIKAVGVPARTPVMIQVQNADGSWSTVDRILVHYPPEPSDSQRYLDDAGYRGNFQVPDLAAPKPTPTPSPISMASSTASPSPRTSPSARDGNPTDKKEK